MSGTLRVLELYCGIGGCAAAVGGHAQVVAAIDISRKALDTYRHNFSHPVFPRTLESISRAEWSAWEAELWWLSPPCQPYTHRGKRRDLDDPRTVSFLEVIQRLAESRPPWVGLENVPGFQNSRAHDRLREVLSAAGYAVSECLLCPTQLGMPNFRKRFYLIASRREPVDLDHLRRLPAPQARPDESAGDGPGPSPPLRFALREILDSDPDARLFVSAEFLRQYAGALHLVDPAQAGARASCFTAAYGRSPVRSGSYLLTPVGVRRFSPAEILRLLGFPATFSLPASLTPRQAWPLVGNSLSVAAVRAVLEPIWKPISPQP